jgi:hypothetical protein
LYLFCLAAKKDTAAIPCASPCDTVFSRKQNHIFIAVGILVLKGFTGADGPEAAAAGRAEVVIEPGKISPALIRLLPLGQGNFSYAGFPALLEDQGLSFASMTPTSLLDESIFRINLLDDNAAENPGSLELAAGYYRLTLALYGGRGVCGSA